MKKFLQSKKRFFYLVMWIILGLLMAMIVHGMIEIPILAWANRGGQWNSFLWFSDYSTFWLWDAWSLLPELVLGGYLGYFFGKKAWQKIYVEGVRGKKYIYKS
jgi:hypothetical protein